MHLIISNGCVSQVRGRNFLYRFGLGLLGLKLAAASSCDHDLDTRANGLGVSKDFVGVMAARASVIPEPILVQSGDKFRMGAL
jgi:hypothetical protein